MVILEAWIGRLRVIVRFGVFVGSGHFLSV